MGRFESTHIVWPPAGWSQFASIQSSAGQSVVKDIGTGRIFGLQYSIDSVPLFKNETKLFRHDVRIDGWEYSILNESAEYSVLSFSLLDRFDLSLPRECFVTDIRTYAAGIAHTRRSAARAVSAALFLIRQINRGQVPDLDRVLRIYKLHPTQAFLYQGDRQLGSTLKRAFGDVRNIALCDQR